MRRQRPEHRIWSFHHRGLLLLAAAVAVMLFFLYGCVAGAAYSPRGRLVFIPLAQVSGSRTTSLFPLLSGRIEAANRMVQCAGRYEKQARSPADPGTLKPMTARELGGVFCDELDDTTA